MVYYVSLKVSHTSVLLNSLLFVRQEARIIMTKDLSTHKTLYLGSEGCDKPTEAKKLNIKDSYLIFIQTF